MSQVSSLASDDSDQEPEPASEPAPRPKKPKIKTGGRAGQSDPEEELGSRIQCEDDEIVPLMYVPCVNGVLMAGSVAVYSGQDCRYVQV